MTAKEYLSQAYLLDQRINSKLCQVEKLRCMTQKVTSVMDAEPVSHTRNVTALQDAIIRLMEAEEELNSEIDTLVDLKTEIAGVIKKVDKPVYQMILEQRYLSMHTWEDIAAAMNYELRWIYRLHGRALQAVEKIGLIPDKPLKATISHPAQCDRV